MKVPIKLIKFVTMTTNKSKASAVINEGKTDEIKIENRVEYGNILLTILFNVALEEIIISITVISKLII